MAIDFVKVGIAAGAGVVDNLLEDADVKAGRTQVFRNWRDYARIGGAAAGYAIQAFWPKWSRWGEALALAETAFLAKSITGAVKGMIPAGARFAPRRTGTPVGRYPAQSYSPEFEGVKLD